LYFFPYRKFQELAYAVFVCSFLFFLFSVSFSLFVFFGFLPTGLVATSDVALYEIYKEINSYDPIHKIIIIHQSDRGHMVPR